MRVFLKLVAFVFSFVVVVFLPLFFLSEPSGEGGDSSLGKTVDLDRVEFIPGKYGGTLYSAVSSDPKTFNLVMAHETSSTDAVGELFEGLTEVDIKTLKPRGALAESWEVKDGGLRWVFHLRKGVKWFDGKEFTADDVVFTYNYVYFNPKIPNSTKDMFLIDGRLPKVRKIDDIRLSLCCRSLLLLSFTLSLLQYFLGMSLRML